MQIDAPKTAFALAAAQSSLNVRKNRWAKELYIEPQPCR
jgi:hypothetical protein